MRPGPSRTYRSHTTDNGVPSTEQRDSTTAADVGPTLNEEASGHRKNCSVGKEKKKKKEKRKKGGGGDKKKRKGKDVVLFPFFPLPTPNLSLSLSLSLLSASPSTNLPHYPPCLTPSPLFLVTPPPSRTPLNCPPLPSPHPPSGDSAPS